MLGASRWGAVHMPNRNRLRLDEVDDMMLFWEEEA
jgi:hypothetical protein